jgi:hypothetical protein
MALPGDTATRELGMSEASDIGKMIADSREDLARDFRDIFVKYSDLDQERTRIRGLQNNLKAREDWLKQNPPPQENK